MTVCSANAAPLRAVDSRRAQHFIGRRQNVNSWLAFVGPWVFAVDHYNPERLHRQRARRVEVPGPAPFGQSTWKKFGFDADFRFRSDSGQYANDRRRGLIPNSASAPSLFSGSASSPAFSIKASALISLSVTLIHELHP